jgi:glutaminyl-peptide cyclotransferase
MLLFMLFLNLTLTTAKMLHAYHFQLESSSSDLRFLSSRSNLSNLDIQNKPSHLPNLLTPLLVPRVSGTSSNAAVREFIVKTLESLDWHVTLDQFTASTPLGNVQFTNIIASRTPNAPRKLILSAHYDSKLFSFPFVGATDSSVPCAILLDIAVTLDDMLKGIDGRVKLYGDAYPGLELVFFDGEEAVKDWTETDSLYGSRHLAEIWSNAVTASIDATGVFKGAKSLLDKIDVLVLLDLLGMKGAKIPNTNRKTAWMWKRMFDIETELFALGLLDMNTLGDRVFEDSFSASQIGDDHMPFMQRG